MSVVLASVYWGELKAFREFREPGMGGFHTSYILAGVPKLGDPPSTRTIHPAQSRDYAGEGRHFPRLVVPEESEVFESTEAEGDLSAKLIAGDLLNEFGQSIPGTPGKGVWICGGKKPTREEIDESTERQILLANYVIARMDRQWISHRRPSLPLQREAANWIGEQREWLHATATATQKSCPFCSKPTPSSAPVCQHCDRVHDPVLMARVEQGLGPVDEVIAEMEKKMPGMVDVQAALAGDEPALAKDAEALAESANSAKELQHDRIPKAARMAYIKDKVHGKTEEPVAAK